MRQIPEQRAPKFSIMGPTSATFWGNDIPINCRPTRMVRGYTQLIPETVSRTQIPQRGRTGRGASATSRTPATCTSRCVPQTGSRRHDCSFGYQRYCVGSVRLALAICSMPGESPYNYGPWTNPSPSGHGPS